jgi:uncharacterized protein YdaU (DUF1376 family)
MAPQKSPAFQFYPKDFIAGTATMSLQEVGAYMRLLCYAWDTGSVPNDERERARIMVCSKKQEIEIWKKVGKKFSLHNDVFLNERLEEERQKQSEYRRRQSDAGKASAATRKQPNGNHGSTTVAERLQPEGNSADCSLQSSSSKEVHQQREPSAIMSHEDRERRLKYCAFVGSRIEVPKNLHGEWLRNGHTDAELRTWYLELDEASELNNWRCPRDAKVYKWLKEHYAIKFPPTPVHVVASGALLERLQAIDRGEIKR